ncbi:MAG: hypothetical protein QN229_03605 [Desulfurococcaceae archaeon TW002]
MSYQFSKQKSRDSQFSEESLSNYCNVIFEVFTHGLGSEEADEVINTLRLFSPRKVYVSTLKEIPESFFNLVRHQYDGFSITKWVNSLRTMKDSVVLGVMNVDAYVDPLNFIFGIALPELNAATVYVSRLRINVSQKGFLARVRKEVVHELGHVFGLRHCKNKFCVMCFSNSLADVDKKNFRMCNAHYTELKNRLPCVSEELLLKT